MRPGSAVLRFSWILLRWVLALVAIGFGIHWFFFREPDPETILAGLDPPPTPVLSPEEEAATFRVPEGFRVELVASEPLLVDPVAMDWDAEGRLYVVEMRGFMPNLEGEGEDEAVGRVVVLSDEDGDGRMDRSSVFLDGLVLPRAIAVLPDAVLIGVPPVLIRCRDANRDLRCEGGEKERIADYGMAPGNVEHRENGLLLGVDGWIYNAKSDRRFRFSPNDEIEIGKTAFRGQWGIAQDDEGLLFSNHNSAFLFGDAFPAEFALRQPAIAARNPKPGVNIELARGESVHGIRIAAGLNRADQQGSLRRDGRQKAPTAVSGLVLQRGDQFGPEFVGDAFVPEAAGSAIAHFALSWKGTAVEAEHRVYPDPDYGEREFLASTDERFRPVDLRVGPDGALWIIDMYRGVIQHAEYVSDHLRRYVETQQLEAPGATGRIWRIVRTDRPLSYAPPSFETGQDQIRALDSANGWVRDQARRRIIHERNRETAAELRDRSDLSAAGRLAALHTLAQMGSLDATRWEIALDDASPAVRRAALRVHALVEPPNEERLVRAALDALEDPDARVRLDALHALGSVAPEKRPLDALLEAGRPGTAIERQAALSSLDRLETRALDRELERTQGDPKGSNADWLAELSSVAYYTASYTAARSPSPDGVREVLDRVAQPGLSAATRIALLEGIEEAQRLPGYERVVLARAHPLFEEPGVIDPSRHGPSSEEIASAVDSIRGGITWPGDPRPGGARPLDEEEEKRRLAGAALFAETCGTCHGQDGRGVVGLAPPLVGSPWVRDADDWLARIILQGLSGPIVVGDQVWNLRMPGHAHDSRFDDATLAGLMTHLRRSWGHADEPVSPDRVARIRADTESRQKAWTADELAALDVAHRLDRYAGVYRVPFVGIEFVIEREGPELTIGRRTGDRGPLLERSEGVFMGDGMEIRFEPGATEAPSEAILRFGTDRVTVSRVDS